MKIKPTEYGSRGVVGIGVPQANPIVEQEAFALRPAGLSLVTTRLTSDADDLAERLRDWLEDTPRFIARYDDLAIDAFGIACTGSSYLYGPDAETELVARHSKELGFPVVTAAGAIRECLGELGAHKIGIVSPYPDWLAARAQSFWAAAGFEVAEIRSVSLQGDNVHAIYELTSADALRVARQLDTGTLDAILFTGTGMPTLGAIEPLHADTGLPVLSSNLCLMSVLARRLGLTEKPLLALPAGLNPAVL